MTDFLSKLLDRALGRVPVLERRRPSLFEPDADAPQFEIAASEPSVSEAPERIEAEMDLPRSRGTPPDRPTEPERIRSLHVAAPPAPEPRHESRPRSADAPDPGAPEVRAHRERAEPPAPAPLPVARPAGRALVIAPLRIRETVVEKEAERPPALVSPEGPSRTPSAVPRVALPPPPPAAATWSKPDPPFGAGEPPPRAPAQPSAIVAPRPVVSAVRASPLAPPRPPVPTRRSEARPVRDAPAPPTVQVTIGRIEVRASPPVTTARASRPASPRLTLEDYLRSREGGST